MGTGISALMIGSKILIMHYILALEASQKDLINYCNNDYTANDSFIRLI